MVTNTWCTETSSAWLRSISTWFEWEGLFLLLIFFVWIDSFYFSRILALPCLYIIFEELTRTLLCRLKLKVRPKSVRVHKKDERREARREEKAEYAARLSQTIENQLLTRLKSVRLHIFFVPYLNYVIFGRNIFTRYFSSMLFVTNPSKCWT